MVMAVDGGREGEGREKGGERRWRTWRFRWREEGKVARNGGGSVRMGGEGFRPRARGGMEGVWTWCLWWRRVVMHG